MRRLALVAIVLLVLVAALFGVTAWLVRPAEFRAPLEATLSKSLGRPVALGAMDLSLFPLPAVRVRDVRIAGDRPGAPPLATVEQVRLRIALLPLLAGRIVLGALELDGPVVTLATDASGTPLPPQLGEAGAAPSEAPSPEENGGIPLAIESIRIERGSLRAGALGADNISLAGSLGLDRRAHLDLAADLPGLVRLRRTHVELEGLGSEALNAHASGSLEALDLAGLAPRLGLLPGSSGTLDGDFELTLRGSQPSGAKLALAGESLRVVTAGATLQGAARLRAEAGGSFELDLTGAEIAAGEAFHKPAGVELRARGALPAALPPARLDAIEVSLAGEKLVVDVDLTGAAPEVALRPGAVDLASLRPLVAAAPEGLAGTVRIAGLKARSTPLELRGSAALEQVALPTSSGTVTATGTLYAQGQRLFTDDLVLEAGGQPLRVRGGYELASDELQAELSAADADLEALLKSLAGKRELGGRLTTRFELEGANLRGAPDRARYVGGHGQLEILNGRLRGFSILKEVLGQFAAVPVVVAALKGKDLSRFDEEEFRRLSGDFTLKAQRLETHNLRIEYRNATAELEGWLNLLSSELSMRGRLLIGEELDAELSGAPRAAGPPKVIPIEGISGTLDRPSVRLDRDAVARVAATYATQGRLREKLDEKLGPGSGRVVDDLLRGLLGPKREEEQ